MNCFITYEEAAAIINDARRDRKIFFVASRRSGKTRLAAVLRERHEQQRAADKGMNTEKPLK